MVEFLLSPTAQAILMGIILAVLIIVGFTTVRKFRNFDDDDRLTANQMLTNFRELRDEGDISDEEFRKLRTVLSEQVQQELNDNSETG